MRAFIPVVGVVFLMMRSSDAPDDPGREVRRLVTSQAVADLSVIEQEPSTGFDISLEHVAMAQRGFPRVHAWRAYLESHPHFHCYVVVALGGTFFRLGGFASPDVAGFDAALTMQYPQAAPAQRAALMAFLLDDSDAPNGEGEFMPWPVLLDTVWAKWYPLARGWPRDTVMVSTDGAQVVRVTILAYLGRRSATYWESRAYSFVFDRTGKRLISWATRVGPSVPLH